MTKTRTTKRALLMSALALFVCVSMLIGTTFAWFTDSVSSKGNKIQAGTLEIDLSVLADDDADGVFNWKSIKDSREALFSQETLWEPGYTEVKVLKVENLGSLALKWVAKFTSQKALSKLADVIDVYVCPSETELAMPDRNLAGYAKVGTLAAFLETLEQTTNGVLLPEATAYLGIALKMQETAGNEYQGLDLGGEFDITIYATQYTRESDSFDNTYDVDAAFDAAYTESVVFEEGVSSVNKEIRNKVGDKIAAIQIPVAAIAEGDNEVTVTVTPTVANNNIVVAANQEVKGFDVSVLGLKEGNTEELTVELRISAGLDPATVKLYHYDVEIPCSYNPYTGYVTFKSATFSPFTVVYDAESEYVAPEVDADSEVPVALVTKYTGDLEAIEWGKYGEWSPSAGVEAKLESAYVFSCKQTAAEAALSPFANWYCDFYVSLDKDLGENQIFLGGNYGSFGWVGFHNKDLTLEANTKIGLLEGVTTNPWTYLDVANFVGTFICGVGDVNNALSGATFTVELRLTNPEDSSDIRTIETINYTFN